MGFYKDTVDVPWIIQLTERTKPKELPEPNIGDCFSQIPPNYWQRHSQAPKGSQSSQAECFSAETLKAGTALPAT